ncbi:MAG: hypothetical protein AAF720_06200 [Pseudomonadota bacterium]
MAFFLFFPNDVIAKTAMGRGQVLVSARIIDAALIYSPMTQNETSSKLIMIAPKHGSFRISNAPFEETICRMETRCEIDIDITAYKGPILLEFD